MNKTWAALKPGDSVEIIAPASAGFTSGDLQQAAEFLISLGLNPILPSELKKTSQWLIDNGSDPFCANTDEYRANHFYEACRNEKSQAIWCMRGGYGSSRLIPLLNPLPPPKTPKLFIGFSDITALHIFMNQKWGWPTIHGKCLFQFIHEPEKHEPSLIEMQQLIFGQPILNYDTLTPLNIQANIAQSITASMTGGNLCLVEHSIGTNWQIETKGKFLFLEDVRERGYRLDRSLEHLYQAGILTGIKALILGDFIPEKEKDGSDFCPYAIRRFAEKLQVPVISFPGMGHGLINHPMPIGTPATLTLGKEIRLSCESGAI